MGIHPKIGITSLPHNEKSAVMEKVLSMLKEERERELSARNLSDTEIIGGICTEPILENGERLGYKVRDLVTGDEAEIAHKKANNLFFRMLKTFFAKLSISKNEISSLPFGIKSF